MKLLSVQKYLTACILMIFVVSQLSYGAVHAEDDSNKYVKDYWDSEQKDNQDHEEIENDSESPAANRTSDEAAVGSSAGDYIKVTFALLFVIGLLYGLLKFVNRKNRLYDKSRFMKNMGGISLGQHKSIQLVIIGDSYYLIGVGDDIRLLKEITDPAEIAKLVEFYEGENVDTTSGMLNQILVKMMGKSKVPETEQTEESADFSNLLNSQLDEMKEERKRQISRLTEKERNQDE